MQWFSSFLVQTTEAERLERFVKDFEDLAYKREIIFESTDINEVI